MAEVLLTNEAFVKGVSSISDNLAGKYMLPSIREAQEVKYRGIVGDTLLAKLKELVGSGAIHQPENAAYKELVDQSQFLIAYNAIVEIAVKVTFKIANAGVVKTPDENIQVAAEPDMAKVQEYYQAKADSEALNLQNFLLNNRGSYPELSEGECHRIHSNLYSAATCGLWLGGPRGKGPYKGRCR
jgi:hypothetical protein